MDMEVTPAMEAGLWARRLGSLQTEVGGATSAMSGMGGGAGLESRAPKMYYLARRSFSIVSLFYRFLNVKAVVAIFNKQNALVGAFSMIVKFLDSL